MKIIDLFCGAGGFSSGFKQAGYDVVMGIDFNPHAIKTHHRNFPNALSLCADLTQVSPAEILEEHGIRKEEIKGIIGGPPCQGFSMAGKRLIDDPRNRLFLEFVKFVEYVRPSFVLMENVPGLLSMAYGKVKEEILSIFSNLGYNMDANILIATHFGVPQIRKRLFFFGVLEGTPTFPTPNPSYIKTVGEAIMDLPPLELGEGGDEYLCEDGSIIYNHYAFPLEEINRKRLAVIPEGGSQKDLPPELRRKKTYSAAYRRLSRHLPSYTISTHFRDEFLIHPTQNRIISIREAARIQTFPDDFVFTGPKSRIGQLGQVGNAVPPQLAKAWAEHIKTLLT